MKIGKKEITCAEEIEEKLTVTKRLSPAELFKDDTIENTLRGIESTVLTFVPDITTEKGRKAIASLANKVARSKTFLDGIRKELVREWKEKAADIDKKGRKIRERLDNLKVEVRKPLTEFEDKEKERIQRHKDTIEEIESYGIFIDQDGKEIDRISLEGNLRNIKEFSDSDYDWEEFEEKANKLMEEKIYLLRKRIEDLKKQEKEEEEEEKKQKEKEEEERKQREEEIRENAKKEEKEKLEKLEKLEKIIAEKEEMRIAKHKGKLGEMKWDCELEDNYGGSLTIDVLERNLDNLERIREDNSYDWEEFKEEVRDLLEVNIPKIEERIKELKIEEKKALEDFEKQRKEEEEKDSKRKLENIEKTRETNNETAEDLMKFEISKDKAKEIVRGIIKGKIRNIRMVYDK